MAKSFTVIGHRGAMGHEPENTLRSFDRAIDMGVDMIEFDVQMSKSGDLVIFHDETLDRVASAPGSVQEKTLDEIKQLRVSGEQIPTLEELLSHVHKRAKINIEIKDPRAADRVVETVKRFVQDHDWTLSDIVISSNDYQTITRVKELYPEVATSVIFIAIPMVYQAWRSNSFDLLFSAMLGALRGAPVAPTYYVSLAQRAKANNIVMNYTRTTQDIIKAAHAAGLKIYLYTVNEPADIERLCQWGADGIFSDYPDRALQLCR